MSLINLPSEVLLDIVEYLRPDGNAKPITGLNAAWKRFPIPSMYQEREPDFIKPPSQYASLYALASACSLFKELCSPSIYEDLNILRPIKCFDDFHVNVVIPNATRVRHLRIARSTITDAEATKVVRLCQEAKSIALYGQTAADGDNLEVAIVKLFEQACLDTLGVYEDRLVGLNGSFSSPLSLLRQLAESDKGSVALKRLELSFHHLDPEVSYLIRTPYPSLEALTCFGFMRKPHPDIWDSSGNHNWARYANLTRLQFRDGSTVYASQLSNLVRHFPSLRHLLISTCDDGDHRADNVRPHGWYKREDALWRVRKPLETIQLEHMDADEIMVMGDIPTKTLIITFLRGSQFIRAMKSDLNLFPGLQRIRIQWPQTMEYENGSLGFDKTTFPILEDLCRQRNLELTFDAEATR